MTDTTSTTLMSTTYGSITRPYKMKRWLCAILCMLLSLSLRAQERVVPLAGRALGDAEWVKASVVTIPFIDDFSTGRLGQALWNGNQVEVTDGWGLYPPTVGVAKLDAVDEEGVLYQNISSSFSADTLMSQRIRLDSLFYPFAERLQPIDSVYLSFYYTVGGRFGNYGGRIGDEPEDQDSLLLEFYVEGTGEWVVVWSKAGCSAESLKAASGKYWQRVMVPIADTRYFNDSFRFRFRNSCSLDPSTTTGLIGNSDQWYVDCVYIDKDRSCTDEVERDVAFVQPARSLLRDYCAIPMRQYRASEMLQKTEALITNRYSSEVASHYGYFVFDADGDTLHRYDGGFENVPPFVNEGDYQQNEYHARAAVDFSYPENVMMTRYKVVHVVKEGVMGDMFTSNDTVVFEQVMEDYYAFDDGSAESGYGLTSTSSSVFLAAKYNLHTADTLLKVKMSFNHTRNDENSNIAFRIVVWDAGSNGPGDVIYRDAVLRYPQFGGLDVFMDYELEYPVALNGTVYIGLEQEGGNYLNLGFDRNYDHSDRLYYRIGSEWQRASAAGSIMFRPCFTPFDGHLGIGSRQSAVGSQRVVVYPNPARERFIVGEMARGSDVTVFDAKGVKVMGVSAEGGTSVVECGEWPQGVYYVRVSSQDGRSSYIKKVIIVK